MILVLVFVVLAVALGAAVLWWTAASFRRGSTTGEAIRHTKHVELLGPGGPDDPEQES
jgi:ABC-type transporter Mla subunit MlaD